MFKDRTRPKVGVKFIKSAEIRRRFGKQIYRERRQPYQDIAQEIMQEIRHLAN